MTTAHAETFAVIGTIAFAMLAAAAFTAEPGGAAAAIIFGLTAPFLTTALGD